MKFLVGAFGLAEEAKGENSSGWRRYSEELLELRNKLGELASIVQPDYRYYLASQTADLSVLCEAEPNESTYQWAHDTIGVLRVWEEGFCGSRKVRVALPDSGAEQSLDVGDNMVKGMSFCSSCGTQHDPLDTDDETGHGTLMFELIGAIANHTGMVGISQHVSVLPLKFIRPMPNGETYGTTFDAAQSICYARLQKVEIVNISWGSACRDDVLLEEIKLTPALFVAAAGNAQVNLDGGAHFFFPASFARSSDVKNILVVGATTKADDPADLSNRGPMTIHMGAPGAHIITSTGGAESGTSLAAALVTGAAALIVAASPVALTPAEVKNLLVEHALPIVELETSFFQGRRLDVCATAQAVVAKDLGCK